MFAHHRTKCRAIVKMLLCYVPEISYADERKCPLCRTLDEQDGVVHFVWGCQHHELIPLGQKLSNTLHTLLQYNEMDKDVMLYVCLPGDLPGAPMFLTPLCLNLYDMHMVRIKYFRR